MTSAREIIETKVAGWQQQVEQLDARQRRLAGEVEQLEVQKQQHIGAIMGVRDLLTLLPAEDAPAPATMQEAQPPTEATADNNPLSDVAAVEQPADAETPG